ncbi:hypothetical protein BKA56DRAFT_622758 [Ilyonectria sp. MPI-CAGE-AT-0026]|nr:hypothetical protein BKA56DRAFT_622758 [Ilyonectria sp. MPI-CAGE-AT-0026]
MADILATVFGLGQCVHETVQFIIKTRQIGKEAAHQIDGYQYEIQMLKISLIRMEGQCDHSDLIPLMQTSLLAGYLSWCRKTLELVSEIVDDFVERITMGSKFRRRLFVAKLALNNDLIHLETRLEKLQNSLERVRICLQFDSKSVNSSDSCMQWLTFGRIPGAGILGTTQPNINDEQVSGPAPITETMHCTQENTTCTQESETLLETCSFQYTCNTTKSLTGDDFKSPRRCWDEGWVSFSIQCPKWLSTVACNVAYHNDLSGLRQFNFRCYNIRSSRSDVFLAVGRGDLNGMLQLFESRDGSPFDRDEEGYSLLHCASSSNQLSICKKLLDLGLGNCIDEVAPNIFTPRQLSLWSLLFQHPGSGQRPNDITQMFENHSGDSVHYASDMFFWLGRKAAPLFFDQPMHMLLHAARRYVLESQVRQHPLPDVMMFLLAQKQPYELGRIVYSNESRRYFLHTVAIGFARYRRDYRDRPTISARYEGQKDKEGFKKWSEMVRSILRSSTADELYYEEHIRLERPIRADSRIVLPEWTGTPLVSVLRTVFLEHFPARLTHVEIHRPRFWQKAVSSVTKQWLQHVYDGGVDLMHYGKREQEIMARRRWTEPKCGDFTMITSRWSATKQIRVEESLPIFLGSFKYGATAEDWLFDWQVDVEKLAGEFWWTVISDNDCPEMPGAWVD